jgi:hypothetical protein
MDAGKAETELEGVLQSVSFTHHDIEHQIVAEYSQDDRAYAEVVINIALDHHIFEEQSNADVEWKKIVRPAMQDQMEEYADMCAMPIWSESTKINSTKTKRSKMCEGPGQPVLLGPPTCECNKKYGEYDEIGYARGVQYAV